MIQKRPTSTEKRELERRLNYYVGDSKDRLEINRLLLLPKNVNVYSSMLFIDCCLNKLICTKNLSTEDIESYRECLTDHSAIVGTFGSDSMKKRLKGWSITSSIFPEEIKELINDCYENCIKYSKRKSSLLIPGELK